uniref:C-type lectin domain-containing protein n=1 Tax=Fundulus heteroclitus TaxID=8078 RepID=A0A3Q2Q8N6_FUNHE
KESFFFISFNAASHSQCRQGWREYESKCYFFSTDTKSWPEANAHCMEQNSHLMSIQDIHERVRSSNPDGTRICLRFTFKIFWIGLNDLIVEGIWEWSDGNELNCYCLHMLLNFKVLKCSKVTFTLCQ